MFLENIAVLPVIFCCRVTLYYFRSLIWGISFKHLVLSFQGDMVGIKKRDGSNNPSRFLFLSIQ